MQMTGNKHINHEKSADFTKNCFLDNYIWKKKKYKEFNQKQCQEDIAQLYE